MIIKARGGGGVGWGQGRTLNLTIPLVSDGSTPAPLRPLARVVDVIVIHDRPRPLPAAIFIGTPFFPRAGSLSRSLSR